MWSWGNTAGRAGGEEVRVGGGGGGGGEGVVKRRDRRWEQNKRRRSELWKQMSVRSRFKDGPDSVISEYDLASYYAHTHTHLHTYTRTHTHTQAICHPGWSLQRGLHLSALFVPVSQPPDKSSPFLQSNPYYQKGPTPPWPSAHRDIHTADLLHLILINPSPMRCRLYSLMAINSSH